MSDLIRRALLGDRESQEECTRQGIVLSCPFCGGTPIFEVVSRYCTSVTFEAIYEAKCRKCGMAGIRSTSEIALKNGKPVVYRDGYMECLTAWNMRTVMPIGRCGSCAWRGTMGCVWEMVDDVEAPGPDGYCSAWAPREEEENG